MSKYETEYEFDNLNFYRENHGKQLYYNWGGEVYWIESPGKPKEKLFSIIGMNATKVFIKPHPEYGEAGQRINREICLFCDPYTQEILHYWQQKEGAQKVPVVHITNRMVQGFVSPRKNVIPRNSGYVQKVIEIPLEYPHPLAKETKYQDYCSGEMFQGVEYFTSSIARPGVTEMPPSKWARDCPWMPWMKLGYGHPARLRFETTIFRVESFERLHPNLVKLVREKLPIYEFAPDESDESNVTSILYFKKHFDAYLNGDYFPIPETT
jgi:Protein of unknown function (DUF1838).